MASPNIPHNAYTDAPQQHPNLILGSLQLLFWLFFRPAAWRNHLKRIDPTLDSDTSLIVCIEQGGSQNLALWRLLIQGYFILPILANLLLGLVLWALGEAIATIIIRVVVGIGIGVTVGVGVDVTFSLGLGVTLGVMVGIAFGMYFGVAFGVAVVVAFGIAFGITFSVARRITFGIAFGVTIGLVLRLAFGVAFGVAFAVAISLAVTVNLWRPFLSFPFLTIWNYLLNELDKRRNGKSPCLFRYHSAFWDEWQRLHLPGLDEYLVFVIEHNPVEGEAALEYLRNSPQSWAIPSGQIVLNIKALEGCTEVEAIRQAYLRLKFDELKNPVTNLLLIFGDISKNVDVALNQKSFNNQRERLTVVAKLLNANLQEISRSRNKYAPRFFLIAKSWLNIITKHIEELIQATEHLQEIDNPYIIGVPLNEQLEIFTGRTSIGLRIEQLLLDRRRPPLLLYGQRRMGKTSLLNNLGKLLPNSIIPMFLDLQGAPSSASDHAGFLYNLARGMLNSAKKQGVTLSPLTREALTSDPFTSFDEWLDKVEQVLEQNTALLMLDEFEVLDSAITKGRFDEQDVLGMLRHLIQHRPRFKVLLAGSHTIAEYQRWASYLINVQVVHISYLKEAEARQLIQRPVKDFTLRYELDAVERVLQLTRCHPFLVQLLCAEIIALKNEQDPSVRRLASLADVEAAIPEAFKSGGFFFADIQNNQVDDNGRAILRLIAAQGEGAIAPHQTISQHFPHADITRKLLLQRELIEEVGEGDRFQVELIRRWFTLG